MAEARLARLDVRCERTGDGSILLEADTPLGAHAPRITDTVLQWAARTPDQIALADHKGPGADWRTLTYAQFDARTAALGQALLDAGAGPDRPVMLVSENRIEAALVTFAAYRIGAPVAPITPAYSAGRGDPGRLGHIVETLRPGVVVAESLATHGEALAAALPDGTAVEGMDKGGFAEWLSAAPGTAFRAAQAAVTGDTVAKILFTSGSTGTPKGALNTHTMLASNAQALRQVWLFTASEPPVLLDWLPWSHTFGGNFVLNLALGTGGTLYIDDGRPLPGLIEKSVANAAEVRPSLHLNAPRGLDMMARVLGESPDQARRFFERLGLVFFASAGLPKRIRTDWEQLIERYATRPVAFCSAWGATETAPLATVLNFKAQEINNIGTPVPGTRLKLAPVDGRFELRVKGPNVTPGYLRRDDLTAAAFDEDGFFRTGDAGSLADPERPEAGVLIEGRLAEDFKLSSGVWVNVSGLRAQLLEAIGPAARDVVLSGPNRNELVALVFLDAEQCQRISGETGDCAAMAAHRAVCNHIGAAIARHNAANPNSSRRMAGHHLMARQLDPAAGELTDKGTVNQAAVLRKEGALCEALHQSAAPDPVRA